MDNVHFNGLFYNTTPNASSSTLPQCVKSDPNLFKDDVDIRFSKTFNTCKVSEHFHSCLKSEKRCCNFLHLPLKMPHSLHFMYAYIFSDSSNSICHSRKVASTFDWPTLFEHWLSQYIFIDLSSLYGWNHGPWGS